MFSRMGHSSLQSVPVGYMTVYSFPVMVYPFPVMVYPFRVLFLYPFRVLFMYPIHFT